MARPIERQLLVPSLCRCCAYSYRCRKLGVHVPVSLKKRQDGQGRLAAAIIALHKLREQLRELRVALLDPPL